MRNGRKRKVSTEGRKTTLPTTTGTDGGENRESNRTIGSKNRFRKPPLLPTGIVTPPVGSPQQEVQQLVMAPGLPLFSGSEPTPRDEGTYDQWKFQVNGMRSSCTETGCEKCVNNLTTR